MIGRVGKIKILMVHEMSYKYSNFRPPPKRIETIDVAGETQSVNPFLPNYKPMRVSYYPPEFYKMKPVVMKIFSDRCFLCGDFANEVHHVDYDTMNNHIRNLCLLCSRCHPKTNFGRKNWQKMLQEKLSFRFGYVYEEV